MNSPELKGKTQFQESGSRIPAEQLGLDFRFKLAMRTKSIIWMKVDVWADLRVIPYHNPETCIIVS